MLLRTWFFMWHGPAPTPPPKVWHLSQKKCFFFKASLNKNSYKSFYFRFSNITKLSNCHTGRCTRKFSLLNCSSFVFLELRLEMSTAHFDAELLPGPDVPDCSPDNVLVKALHKITHHRLELLEWLGLQRIVQTVDFGRLTSSEIFQCHFPLHNASELC